MSELTHAIPHQEDPTQDEEGVMIGDTQMSLDDQIAYAEFSLICAQSHLDEVTRKEGFRAGRRRCPLRCPVSRILGNRVWQTRHAIGCRRQRDCARCCSEIP